MIKSGEVILQRYHIDKFIGQGGMARIYRAHDIQLDAEVALKILHPHLQRQRVIRERLLREVALTRKIGHPSVISIYECLEDSARDLTFLVMEYLSGGDLKNRIVTEEKLNPDTSISIIRQVLSGLSAAHRVGIIHRDIKPHNILFDGQDKVRITDFGLAKTGKLFSLSTQTVISGTPEYYAPECSYSSNIDSRADLYSCGVLLFEMVTGRVPFLSSSPYQTMHMHATVEPPEPQDIDPAIPDWLNTVILKALKKDPADRFQNADEFGAALEKHTIMTVTLHPHKAQCSQCGAEVLQSFPYCFSCGNKPVSVMKIDNPEEQYAVFVQGPGNAAERITHADRKECLKILSGFNLNTKRLSKSLPRLPFVLIDSISAEKAQQIVHRLKEEHIQAFPVKKRGKTKAKSAVKKQLRKKIRKMSLRYYAIYFGVLSGTYTVFSLYPLFGIAAAISIALSVPGYQLIRYRMPEISWSKRKDYSALTQLFDSIDSIDNAELLEITRKIVSRSNGIIRLIETRDSFSEPEKQNFIGEMNGLLVRTTTLILQTQKICSALETINSESLYAKFHTLENRIIASKSIKESELLMAEQENTRQDIEMVQEMETSRDLIYDRLLRLTTALDALVISIAESELNSARRTLHSMEQIVTNVTIDYDSQREADDL